MRFPPFRALQCRRHWGSPHWGRRILLVPWQRNSPEKGAATPKGGVEVVQHLPDVGPRAVAAPTTGAGARSTTTTGPKKVYTLEKRQGSKNHPRPRGGPKKFIPSENATVTQNLCINFSGGRSAKSALPDRALASRQQSRAGALAPAPSPTPGKSNKLRPAPLADACALRGARTSSADTATADMRLKTHTADLLKILPGQNKGEILFYMFCCPLRVWARSQGPIPS